MASEGRKAVVTSVTIAEVSLDAATLAALELVGIKGADGAAIASNANPVPVSDAGGSLTVDGTVALDAATLAALESITVSGTVSVTEPVSVDDNGGSLTVDAVDLDIRNLVFATDKVDASGSTLGANSGVDVGDVTINNAAGASAVNVQDGGNSLTVDNGTLSVVGGGAEATALRVTLANDSTGLVSVDDNGGSLTVDASNLDIRDLVFASDKVDASGTTLGANSGVDIGDVTINNAAGAAAVNIQDGGNSITVDGTVSVTEPVSVDDNGGSLTVDGTVTANAGTDLNTSALALEATLGSVKTAVELIDDVVKVEDAGHTTGDKGVMPLAVRNDTRGALAGTDLDYSPFQLNASGDLRVDGSAVTQPVSDAGGSLTVDNAALSVVGGGTEATAQRVTIANDSTGVLSVDDNGASLTVDNATLAVVGGGTEATALRVTLASDSTGLVSVDDNGGSLTVDASNLDIRDLVFATDKVDASGSTLGANSGVDIGDVDVTSVTPGTAATNLGKAEDAGHTTGDVGVMALAVRNDDDASRTTADDDYSPISTDATGRVKVVSTCQTATLSNVAASASSVQLLAANTSRAGFILYNDSISSVSVKYGTTASSTSLTFAMSPGEAYVSEWPVYSGRIDAIWNTASGSMRITELT